MSFRSIEPASTPVERWAASSLSRHPLLWSEVTSVLNEMAFRGEISDELAQWALERFVGGEINVEEQRPDDLKKTALDLARELGWAKTYDAEYLATARLLAARVVTLDMRLNLGRPPKPLHTRESLVRAQVRP